MEGTKIRFWLTLILGIAIVSGGFMTACASPSYTIDGDTVYIDDSHAYISATPHTLHSSGWVYFNITSRDYSGEIDAVWGFDTDNAKPVKAELYSPEYYNVTRSLSCPEPYWYNYTISPLYAWCWNDVPGNESNGTEPYTAFVWGHEFEWADLPARTIYWNEPVYREWWDISGAFEKVTYDFDGKDTWHYKNDIPITAGQSYLLRAWIDVPMCLAGDPGCDSFGKYDFAIKPSGDTIQEAVASGHLYFLDPWWNVSMARWPILSLDNASGTFLLNDTYGVDSGTGTQYVWAQLAFGETPYAYNDINGKWYVANDSAQLPTFIDEGNGTGYGTPYDASTRPVFHFNGTLADATGNYIAVNDLGTVEYRPGKIGSSVYCSGDDRIDTGGHSMLDASAAWTIMFWVNQTDADGNGHLFRAFTDANNNLQILTAGLNAIRLYLRTGGGTAVDFNIAVTGGSWSHVAYIGNASGTYAFVDGKYAGGGATKAMATFTKNLTICAYEGVPAYYWQGEFDDIVIANSTYSEADITAHFNNTHPDGYITLGAKDTYSAGGDEFYATTQISPGNATYISTNPPGDFCFNYTGTYATASCELQIGSGGYGINASTLNATTTCITANDSVASDGIYDWLINCTNGTDWNASVLWEMYVDATAPQIRYIDPTPANLSYQNVAILNQSVNLTETNYRNISFYIHNTTTTCGVALCTYHSYAMGATVPTYLRTAGMPDGEYNINVTSCDIAGNCNTTETRTFTIDTVAPDITWLPPTPNNETYDWDGFYINVSLSETGDTCYGEMNGTNYTMTHRGSNVWQALMHGLTHENQYNFLVYCNDSAGNLNATGMRYTVLNWPVSPGPVPSSDEVYEGDAEFIPYEPEWEWELWEVLLIIAVIAVAVWMVMR